MLNQKSYFRNIDFTAAADNHAFRVVAAETVPDEPWEVPDVSYHQPDSSLHFPDSRPNGHLNHENPVALRDFRLHDVYFDPVLHFLAERDVLRHLEDVQQHQEPANPQRLSEVLLLPILRLRTAADHHFGACDHRRDLLLPRQLAPTDRQVRVLSPERASHRVLLPLPADVNHLDRQRNPLLHHGVQNLFRAK